MDDGIGDLGEVEGVEDDVASLAKLVEGSRALRESAWDSELMIITVSKDHIVMTRLVVERGVLIEAGRLLKMITHDDEGSEWKMKIMEQVLIQKMK